MSQAIPATALLDGVQVRAIFVAAAVHLRESASAVDAINVYPVPDGDTGSNMSATLSEAVERTLLLSGHPALPDVLATISKGALYGARGNSGVILSQALRGFSTGVGGRLGLDAQGLAEGLGGAADAAYAAVTKPQEGTMLTVLRAASDRADEVVLGLPDGGREAPCHGVLAAAVLAAEASEAATIDQLAALREAGVTDAGGEGICVILRGLLAAIRGELPPPSLLPTRAIATLSGHATETFGFCTEFLIEPVDRPIDLGNLRASVTAPGNTSLVVVGDTQAARVHVHTPDPQTVLDAVETLGRVSRIKIEDMSFQNARFAATGSGATKRVALLAVSHGEGFDEIFHSLGATTTDLGRVAKPTAGAIAAAADALRTPDVIVLPNHKNVLLAAEQAVKLASCTLHVSPTRTLPGGIAAAIAFSPAASATENLRTMGAAGEAVRTVEVTISAANRSTDGIDARDGEAIALVDGRLVASTPDPADALLAGLARVAAGSLITVYGGEATTADSLESARQRIADAFPVAEVEAISAGQPLYPFRASVE